MSNDLIRKSDVINIIENKRLLVGKSNLPVEYNLGYVQEEIENLSFSYNLDKVIKELGLQAEKAKQMHDGSAVTAFMVAMNIVKRGGLQNEID